MEKYRLKKEAKQFFGKYLHDSTGDFDYWKTLGIPTELLDKIKSIEVKVIAGGGEGAFMDNSSLVSKFDPGSEECVLRFVLNISNIKFEDFVTMKVDKLMLGLEIVANKFFED